MISSDQLFVLAILMIVTAFLSSVVAAIVTILNSRKIDRLHAMLDNSADDLVRAEKRVSHAEGVASERNRR